MDWSREEAEKGKKMAVIDNADLMHKMRKFVKESRRPPGEPFFGPPPRHSGHGGPFGMPPGSSPDGHRRHGHRRHDPLSRERLLVVIDHHPDGIRQKALAEKLGIGQSSVSELVNKLEYDGYLQRKIDPSDKRATLLFLTELGQARAAEVADERQKLFQNLFSSITEEEKEVLSGLLDKLLDGLERQESENKSDE